MKLIQHRRRKAFNKLKPYKKVSTAKNKQGVLYKIYSKLKDIKVYQELKTLLFQYIRMIARPYRCLIKPLSETITL